MRNKADQVIYSTDKTLKEHGDKISDDEKKKIAEAKERLESAMKTDSVEIINQKIDDLMQASHKLAEELYKQSAEQSAQGQAQGEPQGEQTESAGAEKKGDEAVDADFEVVDDKEDKKG